MPPAPKDGGIKTDPQPEIKGILKKHKYEDPKKVRFK